MKTVIPSKKSTILNKESAKGSSSISNDGPSFGPLDCFVATACYGQDDSTVNSLRLWRDEIIKQGTEKSKLLFIRAYYSFIGKPGAWVLQKLPFLKPIARRGIKFFIRLNNIS
ncbi:MAG: hypothetical protein WCW54_00225 [Candidatus Paceibacterota bacterium]